MYKDSGHYSGKDRSAKWRLIYPRRKHLFHSCGFPASLFSSWSLWAYSRASLWNGLLWHPPPATGDCNTWMYTTGSHSFRCFNSCCLRGRLTHWWRWKTTQFSEIVRVYSRLLPWISSKTFSLGLAYYSTAKAIRCMRTITFSFTSIFSILHKRFGFTRSTAYI